MSGNIAAKRTKPLDRGESGGSGTSPLEVTIISFGYKEGPPPAANMVFDVRFLKNPYWVESLRPLTGLDQAVRDYVLQQRPALDFLDSLERLLAEVLPRLVDLGIAEFAIAFGCTGGQHRSTALAEALAGRIGERFPQFCIVRLHRELAGRCDLSGGVPADCQAERSGKEQAKFSGAPVKQEPPGDLTV